MAPLEEQMREWFDDADADGSGVISFEDFKSLMTIKMSSKKQERRKQGKASMELALENAPKAIGQQPPLPPLLEQTTSQQSVTPDLRSPNKPLPALPAAPPRSSDSAASEMTKPDPGQLEAVAKAYAAAEPLSLKNKPIPEQ